MLALILAACLIPSAQYAGLDIRPMTQLPQQGLPNHPYNYAWDGSLEILGTPQGVFRTPSMLGQFYQQVLHRSPNEIAVDANGAIYVLLPAIDNPRTPSTDHTVLRSTDGGGNFTPIDAGLHECVDGVCRFMSATQIEFVPGRIFLVAGGNLLVSADNGVSWQLLYGIPNGGNPTTQTCPMTFAVRDRQVIIGGNCRPDGAFLSVGTLRADLQGWETTPVRVTTPNLPKLDDRNVHFIEHADGDIFAGVDGGLLKSCDGGVTWRFVIEFPVPTTAGRPYPRIDQFLAPMSHSKVRIVAGFDEATARPYLAWSANSGETWIDVSGFAAGGTMSMLAERWDGLPLVFIKRGSIVTVSRFTFHEKPLRKRAIRF